ncbi:MAG: UDP-N-acetylglucosamine 2-epimerase (hydrolyzing) [Thauera sp.]|nr:UDP-N-acetylglucosamine 2-epimerase (hydrolyzing) [Thauera sp.]
MTRRIAVFTGTRAEYGLLYWLMRELQSSAYFELQVLIGAMHLSPEFGNTWTEIEHDGFSIDARIEMLLSSDTRVGMAKSLGLGTIGFADALDRLRPELLVVLGDRFEVLAAAQAALILGIPIAHLHGGELTEGACDDAFRHAVTKMSALHFVATERYRQRVVQLGEDPSRVFNVGALGLDHLRRSPRMSLDELRTSLGFDLRPPFLIATYHPATQSDEDPVKTFDAMLDALDAYPDHQVVLTYPNADSGGRALIPRLESYAASQQGRVLAIPSLGFRRYLGALAHASAVIGNSSSGIIEVPAFGIPTVNIGKRQGGRIAADSVLHCGIDPASIKEALKTALSPEFGRFCQTVNNPYGQGDAAASIARIIASHPGPFDKHFHDLAVQ